jgi:hypothetical protein
MDQAKTSETLNESQFYMWRTLFALVHADHVVTREEQTFMESALDQLTLTDYQRSILVSDTMESSDIAEMFKRITEQNDRVEFFRHARILVWCDGDFDKQEQEILAQLTRTHASDVDFDKLVSEVSLSFDEGEKGLVIEARKEIELELDSGESGNLMSALKKIFKPY